MFELALEFCDGLFEHAPMSGGGRSREIASSASHRQLDRVPAGRFIAFRSRQCLPHRRTALRLGLLEFDVLAFEAPRHFVLLLVCYQ